VILSHESWGRVGIRFFSGARKAKCREGPVGCGQLMLTRIFCSLFVSSRVFRNSFSYPSPASQVSPPWLARRLVALICLCSSLLDLLLLPCLVRGLSIASHPPVSLFPPLSLSLSLCRLLVEKASRIFAAARDRLDACYNASRAVKTTSRLFFLPQLVGWLPFSLPRRPGPR
jgi:hypothetical protein